MDGVVALNKAKKYVDNTLKGAGALKGKDGFSPIIKESPDNTEEIYQLDIINQLGSYRTPNLKGCDNSSGLVLTPLTNMEIMGIIKKANEQIKI